jgi:hypothetical protein
LTILKKQYGSSQEIKLNKANTKKKNRKSKNKKKLQRSQRIKITKNRRNNKKSG